MGQSMGQAASPDSATTYNNGVAAQKKKDADAMAAQTANYNNQFGQFNQTPGYVPIQQDKYETEAGVEPAGFRGNTDINGNLLSQYTADPANAGAMSKELSAEALGAGPSKWATSALGQQGFEETQARGAAGSQAQTANSNAEAQLMRLGGLGGGARTSLARSGARDALMAGQNIGAQGVLARYGINQTDAQRKQGLLDTGAKAEQGAQTANIGMLAGNNAQRQAFDQNRYNQQMSAWAAMKSADAIRAAGG